MSNMDINLNKFNKQDVISTTSSLLYLLRSQPQYSTVSELVYLLDYDNFIKLITYYGGTTIRIPTVDEIDEMLRVLLLYQYYYVNKLSWKESLIKLEIPESESLSYRSKLSHLKRLLSSQSTGGRCYE